MSLCNAHRLMRPSKAETKIMKKINIINTPTMDTVMTIGRITFDLAVDARADIPGLWGRLLAGLLSLTSRVAYGYAIRYGEKV